MGKVGSKSHINRHGGRRLNKPDILRRSHSISKSLGKATNPSRLKKPGDANGAVDRKIHARPKKAKVPFHKGDHVLLVGEGDFSFTLSLARTYKIESITATAYDTEESVRAKYPHSEAIVSQITGKGRDKGSGNGEADEFRGFSPPPSPCPANSLEGNSPSRRILTSIYYGIDATKLSAAHKKTMRRHGPFSKIVFNFPHVGGLSTDVNRQTRANQQLIQGFFGAAKPLLASTENPIRQHIPRNDAEDKDAEHYASNDEDDEANENPPPPLLNGQILVTLFTGEAYTDWNIRDIARDQGLRVVESFRFPWQAYPGYQHARTIGEVKTGKDRSAEGKRKGAWRGEEREARCFVFEIKDGNENEIQGRKRKRGNDSSDND